jgi:hypothetical protein
MNRRTKRRLLFSALVLALFLLAVAGWTVQGVRLALGGRPLPA